MNPISISPDNAMGLLAGAIVTVLTWAVQQFGHIQVPAEVAAAVTTIVYFVVCHFVPVASQAGPNPQYVPKAPGA